MSLEKLLNNILNDCITKSKVKVFHNYINDYGLDPSMFTYFTEEKKTNRNKIPIDILRKKLLTKIHKIEILEINNISDRDEVINKCDSLIDKIHYEDKFYYYYSGKYLSLFKSHYTIENTIKNFNEFIEERYNIKISTINKYIRFSKLCDEYSELLECGLGFDEIMKNVTEIKQLYE